MKLRNKKTGEIGEPRVAYQEIYVDTTEHKTYCYKSIAKFNEEWEDYKPAEPVIKDPKIRKAVRAWAEANIIKKVMFEYVEGVGSYFSDCGCQIRFYEDLHLMDSHEYTLTELCGEEEE